MLTTSGPLASRPAVGNAGNLYFATDAPYLFRDNGTSWESYGLTEALSPPNDALFSWVNQGGSSIVVANGQVRLNCVTNSANDSFRCRVKALPAPPYTLTLGFLPLMRGDQYKAAGLCLRESTSGKLITLLIDFLVTGSVLYYNTYVIECGSPTGSFNNKSNQPFPPIMFGSPLWLRITDDGTTLTFWMGADPFTWIAQFTEPRASFLTGGADQYGFCMDPYNQDCSMVVVHLKEN